MMVGDEGPGTATEEEEFTAKLSGDDRGDRDRGPRGEPMQTERGYTSYKVGVGHTHGARPPGIVGAITGEGGLTGKDIGKIQIFPNFSLVQIRGSLSPEQMSRISGAKVGGRELRIGPTRDPGRQGRAGTETARSAATTGGRFDSKRRPSRRHEG